MQTSLILDALGASEKLRIDRCCPDHGPDIPHRFADCIKEGIRRETAPQDGHMPASLEC
jgi:hypothetical protein